MDASGGFPAARDVVVRPAAAGEWPVVERLVQLYLHDLSEFRRALPGPDGLLPFPALPSFRTAPGRRAWLLERGGGLAGFALTRPWERGGTSLSAFFVVRALRRTGTGRTAALQLLGGAPGRWGVAFQEANPGAGRFWRRTADLAAPGAWVEEPPAPGSADTWLVLDVPPQRPAGG